MRCSPVASALHERQRQSRCSIARPRNPLGLRHCQTPWGLCWLRWGLGALVRSPKVCLRLAVAALLLPSPTLQQTACCPRQPLQQCPQAWLRTLGQLLALDTCHAAQVQALALILCSLTCSLARSRGAGSTRRQSRLCLGGS